MAGDISGELAEKLFNQLAMGTAKTVKIATKFGVGAINKSREESEAEDAELRQKASRADMHACYELADRCFDRGADNEGIDWLQKAAIFGHTAAQGRLKLMNLWP